MSLVALFYGALLEKAEIIRAKLAQGRMFDGQDARVLEFHDNVLTYLLHVSLQVGEVGEYRFRKCDDILRVFKVEENIRAPALFEDEGVGTRSTGQQVVTSSAFDSIVSCIAVKNVPGGSAGQGVVPAPAQKDAGPIVGRKNVVSRPTDVWNCRRVVV